LVGFQFVAKGAGTGPQPLTHCSLGFTHVLARRGLVHGKVFQGCPRGGFSQLARFQRGARKLRAQIFG
jgi:hypothetical protein